MKKVVVITAILMFAMASITYAGIVSGPRVTYGGLVQTVAGGVVVDTLICVFNPNNCHLRNVQIHVFDATGTNVATSNLYTGGTMVKSATVKRKGWNWITLGALVSSPFETEATKFTWVVTWNTPSCAPPDRGAVIEVKELVYSTAIDPVDVWLAISSANIMSEAALGFDGVGYSAQ
jgi:hypothetical protein